MIIKKESLDRYLGGLPPHERAGVLERLNPMDMPPESGHARVVVQAVGELRERVGSALEFTPTDEEGYPVYSEV